MESSVWGMLSSGPPRAEGQWTVVYRKVELRAETGAGDSNLGGIRL